MMDKRVKKIKRYIPLVSMVIVLACNPVLMDQVKAYPNDLSDFLSRGDYEIDPNRILIALDRGESNVFKPILATPEAFKTPYPTGSFPWHQSEYLKVAAALHQFVWKEDLANWSLFSMLFFHGCQDNPSGFDSGEVTYFKTVNSQEFYSAREMDIYPIGGGVSWGGGTNFPRPLFGWRSIDLGNLKVTADDALQMAEVKGGRNLRSKVNNKCEVHVLLKPNGADNNWLVTYYGTFPTSGSSSIFEMTIDPYTGNYRILPSN